MCAVTAIVLYWVVVRPQRQPRSLHEANNLVAVDRSSYWPARAKALHERRPARR